MLDSALASAGWEEHAHVGMLARRALQAQGLLVRHATLHC